MRNDILNLGASLAKLGFFFHYLPPEKERTNISRFAVTEVEYVLGVCRSLFDLLQKTIAAIWETIELHDEQRKKRQLPAKTFAKMILSNDKLLTATEIEAKFTVPQKLAEFYHRHGNFFRMLRATRDKIHHHGWRFRRNICDRERFRGTS
jgi:hypothetical protein